MTGEAVTEAPLDPDLIWRVSVFAKGSDKPVSIEFGPNAPDNALTDAAMHAVARQLIQLGTSLLTKTVADDFEE